MTADALLIPTLPVDPDPAPERDDWLRRVVGDEDGSDVEVFVLAYERPLAELREREA
jgi:hypothetical protein